MNLSTKFWFICFFGSICAPCHFFQTTTWQGSLSK